MTSEGTKVAVVGCDIGTQSAKAILVTDDGVTTAHASSAYAVDFPAASHAQQDARYWRVAFAKIMSRLARESSEPIAAIGISAQVDGVVAVDQNLDPVHPALIWMDRRASHEAENVRRALGSQSVYDTTGLNCDASHTGPKMRWLLDHLAAPSQYLLPPSSSITGWLTGEVLQDHANASSSLLYDIEARQWSDRMLEAFDIDPAMLAPIGESTDTVGYLKPGLASEWGLADECLVVAGTGDEHAAAIGAGASVPGIVIDVMGTAEPIGSSSDKLFRDPTQMLEIHAHAVPDAWFIENPGFVSGGSVLWLSRILGIDQPAVLDNAEQSEPGARGLTFVPALSGSMVPRWNDLARGSFTGLTMEHGREDLCRAVLEACVFAGKDVIDRLVAIGIPVHEIRVTGGGARSQAWLQMKADVIGRQVLLTESESCAIGAALLAAVGMGRYPDIGAASEDLLSPPLGYFEPDSSRHEEYLEAYSHYRQAFDALEPTWADS